MGVRVAAAAPMIVVMVVRCSSTGLISISRPISSAVASRTRTPTVSPSSRTTLPALDGPRTGSAMTTLLSAEAGPPLATPYAPSSEPRPAGLVAGGT